jgi:hypothetical protein
MYWVVELTFGHNRFDGEPLPEIEVEVAELICWCILTDLFSGCRLSFCIGMYAADGEEPTIEPCSVLKAYSQEEIDASCLKDLEALASTIAGLLHQRSVLLSIQRFEGIVAFIGPSGESTRVKVHPAA